MNQTKDLIHKRGDEERRSDIEAQAEEEKQTIEKFRQEFIHFENINAIRLLSRELFTKVNCEEHPHRVEQILNEVY